MKVVKPMLRARSRNLLWAALLTAACGSALSQEQKQISESKGIDQFVLDGQYSGPFKDTVVQRWVDRITGNVCYLYIPVVVPGVPNSGGAPGQPRVYGPNGIGTISCVPRPSK